MNILQLRLHNQHLMQRDFEKPGDVVTHLGAVQAQDFAAAKWSLGIRMAQATDVSIEEAFNKGEILRTHVMRPTWHFVMPEDIRWMLELTAPRVKAFMAHYNRKLELDDALFAKSNKVITTALKNNTYRVRQEFKKLLEEVGITTDVQRLAHIVSWAELDGLICSGPKQGKQLTYALLEERVPKAKTITREEALAKLALKYVTSHGPVQLKDFVWWSGLLVKDAQTAFDLIKAKCHQETHNGKTYWFASRTKSVSFISHRAFLLSIFDEYTIAYKDRSDMKSEAGDIERMLSMGNALTAVIVLDGRVIGTWKRVIKKNKVEVKLSPFRSLQSREQEAIDKAVDSYGKFLGLSTIVI